MNLEKVSENCIYETEVEIKNERGLHMVAAMRFIDASNLFASDITVSCGKKTVDGKSIVQATMLAATKGCKLRIKAKGCDAEQAISVLQELVEENMFYESTTETPQKK